MKSKCLWGCWIDIVFVGLKCNQKEEEEEEKEDLPFEQTSSFF